MMKTIAVFVIDLIIADYAIFSALLIVSVPYNRFEWMLDDPLLKDQKLTFCTLPLDMDVSGSFITFMYFSPLLLIGLVMLLVKRPVHYTVWLAVGLLVLWYVRFFLLFPDCPLRETY